MFRVATAAMLVGWLAVAGLAIGAGTYMCWDALFARPNLYAHLRKEGVRAEAHLVDCRSPSLPSGPALRCQLSLTFRMQTRTWHYTGGPASQFTGIDIKRIPMLVDPQHPSTAYTVHDVESGDNTGWSAAAVLGVIAVGFGLLFLLLPLVAFLRPD